MKTRTMFLTIMSCLFVGLAAGAQTYEQRETADLLPEGTFTNGIEGPATDKAGNLYAVNYGKEGTISTYAHESRMNQPNDIALAPGGNLYASDPDWPNQKGQLWLITPDGKVTLLESDMGTTNGIDVSPDGKKLYVNESAQLKVWIYDIKPDGTLKNKRLFHTFEGFGMDGIRCDVKGNLYLCRYDKGTVAVINPKGKLIREIQLKGKKPSNITFGGPDNRRCYVTLQDRGCFETFTAEHPGRE